MSRNFGIPSAGRRIERQLARQHLRQSLAILTPLLCALAAIVFLCAAMFEAGHP